MKKSTSFRDPGSKRSSCISHKNNFKLSVYDLSTLEKVINDSSVSSLDKLEYWSILRPYISIRRHWKSPRRIPNEYLP